MYFDAHKSVRHLQTLLKISERNFCDEVTLRGQQIYIHVGDQKYWETELLRPYRPDREPRGRRRPT